MKNQHISANTPTTRIRRAQRRDAPRLIDLIAGLALHHGDTATPSLHCIERDIFGPAACGMALVAERGERIVGYALLACMPRLHWGQRVMTVQHLYVEEGLRGSGIGRHLIAMTVAEARRQECSQVIIGTHPDNLGAQALYQSLGFLPCHSGGPRFQLDLPLDGALPRGWV